MKLGSLMQFIPRPAGPADLHYGIAHAGFQAGAGSGLQLIARHQFLNTPSNQACKRGLSPGGNNPGFDDQILIKRQS
jgi:hypothetical protein